VNVVPIAAVAVLLVVVAWLLAYKVKHPHTKEDLVKARKDSITRSRSVVSGKVQEHLAPLFPEFISQFNPKDARFLGSPLDFVVFDGLDDGEVQRIVFAGLDDGEVQRVVFVEIKTGKAGLVSRERLCRNAIEAGRVEYQLLRLEDASSGVVLEEPVLE
jgi:predicted Holliday junction resolvase-like endonuclease